MASELKRLRKQQAEAVMPLIGPLLDAWEMLPGDLRAQLVDEAEPFVTAIEGIWDAMEASDGE